MKMEREKIHAALKESGAIFRLCSRKAKLLSTLAWDRAIAEEFFQKKEQVLPTPQYNVDRQALEECKGALDNLERKLTGDHRFYHWLRRLTQSYRSGCNLLLNLESEHYFKICSELYGNSQMKFFNGQSTNLELARAISSRISVYTLNDIQESYVKQDAEQFAQSLEIKLKERLPTLPVKIEVSDAIVAKVVAGMNRVRIRKNARFSTLELEALFKHEIESHCVTAQNGALQPYCDFLAAGGPRSTMTQEGLAVFFEVYGHTMSQQRLVAITDRVEATYQAEQGADFIQVYRWFKERSESPLEAFYATQRVFRGSKLTGGGPFTKDVVYLPGLLAVYNFLRFAVKNQNRILIESLVCGRLALEDAGVITWLRTQGIIQPPKFVPYWLASWEGLVSYFSLSALLGTMDLSGFQQHFDSEFHFADWDFSL